APLDLLLELGADITNTDPFAAARGVPSRCGSCSYVESCGGGCAGRRQLLHALDEPDPYCPVVRGGARKLKVQMAKSRELPKLESACTPLATARWANDGRPMPNSSNYTRRRVLTIAIATAASPAAVVSLNAGVPADRRVVAESRFDVTSAPLQAEVVQLVVDFPPDA